MFTSSLHATTADHIHVIKLFTTQESSPEHFVTRILIKHSGDIFSGTYGGPPRVLLCGSDFSTQMLYKVSLIGNKYRLQFYVQSESNCFFNT